MGALVGDDQFDVVPRTRGQHGIGFAQVDGHRFLAQDGFRSTRGGGNHHFGMLLVPRADVYEIRMLGVQHLPEIGIALVLGDAEEVAIFAPRIRMGVGARRDLNGLAGDALPATGVNARNRAAGDNRCSIRSQTHSPRSRWVSGSV